MLSMMRPIIHRLGFDEKRCLACGEPFAVPFGGSLGERYVCQSCLSALRQKKVRRCSLCGMPLFQDCLSDVCFSCTAANPPWKRLYFTGYYEGLLREMILRGKFHGELPLLRFMGMALGASVPAECSIDAVVPIPLHTRRLRSRGYNQAQILAAPVADRLRVPLKSLWLERVVNTVSQVELQDRQRRTGNLAGAFRASSRISGRRILLIDDVMTTGTTLKEASQTLLDAGAAEVHLAVAARARLK
ncbi:MAG: ComF family protein [Desulfovibrionaceae bacterium]|nr:ComF family protein [Desulfovibrionaceae bacterium]